MNAVRVVTSALGAARSVVSKRERLFVILGGVFGELERTEVVSGGMCCELEILSSGVNAPVVLERAIASSGSTSKAHPTSSADGLLRRPPGGGG